MFEFFYRIHDVYFNKYAIAVKVLLICEKDDK